MTRLDRADPQLIFDQSCYQHWYQYINIININIKLIYLLHTLSVSLIFMLSTRSLPCYIFFVLHPVFTIFCYTPGLCLTQGFYFPVIFLFTPSYNLTTFCFTLVFHFIITSLKSVLHNLHQVFTILCFTGANLTLLQPSFYWTWRQMPWQQPQSARTKSLTTPKGENRTACC